MRYHGTLSPCLGALRRLRSISETVLYTRELLCSFSRWLLHSFALVISRLDYCNGVLPGPITSSVSDRSKMQQHVQLIFLRFQSSARINWE